MRMMERTTRTPVYEKLRKRSYRRWGGDTGVSVHNKMIAHHWYVKGVRDALNEVRDAALDRGDVDGDIFWRKLGL